MRRVIVESPFAGDADRNIAYARLCLRDCLLRDEAPIASHLLYTQPTVLNDAIPDERKHGIEAGLAWGDVAQATVVYGDYGISRGMQYGISRAESEHRPIEFRSILDVQTPEEKNTLKAYQEIAVSRNSTHANPEFWRNEFNEFSRFLPNGKVIDVGCGAGRDAILFKEDKSDHYGYTGIDISDDMLAAARALAPYAVFMKESLYRMSFASGSCDGFWAAASLLHIPKTRADLALQEMRRVVRNDGIGFIALKEGDGEAVANDGRFFSYYREEELKKLLQRNGFVTLTTKCAARESDPRTVWLTAFVRILK